MENGKRKMENINRQNYQLSIINYPLKVCLFVVFAFFLTGCNDIQSPKTEPFISQNIPPTIQEFRWSNGNLPKSFDPARVSAAPETDVIRAIYEGLTDVDSKSLKPIPAVATKWEASEDFKTWTFQLRQDAKWSNGETVTAPDFVRSWKRLTELGDKVPNRQLVKNIVGMNTEDVLPVFADEETEEIVPRNDEFLNYFKQSNSNVAEQKPATNAKTANVNSVQSPKNEAKVEKKSRSKTKFGIESISKFTLQITLVQPDKDFPSLVAHPVFYPVYSDGKNFENSELSANFISNGAFIVSTIAKDSLVLERAPNYWNRNEIKLEKVRFVPTETAEQALTAYRNGQVDVVTNANFAPLALKLLRTYEDLRQSKHSALSFYEFNQTKKPFDDARVREALAIAIERDRLTEDEMDGATKSAFNFLPFSEENLLKQDFEKAKKLLSEAGFANGQNFPTIKLLIGRNDLQKRIARSVAKMWKKNLNVETEIIIKEKADFENAFQNGEFDIVRRGVVLPTNDETANMLAMFEKRQTLAIPKIAEKEQGKSTESVDNQILNEKTAESPINFAETEESPETKIETENITQVVFNNNPTELILTETEALKKLPAIPLYFPMSYSLVKPYIQGFETNPLDAPSLKNVEINNEWQGKSEK